MANSFVRYTGNGSTTAYAIPFSYRSTDDIIVTIGGVATTAFTYNGAGTQITFTSPPADQSAIQITRKTSQGTKLVDYSSGSVLTENDLDTDSDQAFFMSQEAIDDANDVITIDDADFQWTAQSKRIKLVADPTGAQDVATKNYTDTAAASQVALATTQATNAATSATSAASSATTATTKASEASTSATNAATSATTATTKASEASTSASNAATSATNAGNSATAAATSETNAGNSATAAATSATNAGNSETAAATSATNAASSATAAASSATSASGSATTATTKASEASTSATNAAASATTATTQASTATTKASEAATSATNAASSATSAASSATTATTKASEASTSATNAAASYDNFDDRYLGSKSSDPTVDNDGDALVTGALYFNSSSNQMKVYGGSSWAAVAPTATSASDLSTGTLPIARIADGAITNAKLAGSITGDKIIDPGRRNLIINGDMRVAQRGTSTTSGAQTYLIDRFYTFQFAASNRTVSQVTDAPDGFTNALKVQRTAGDTATTDVYLSQPLESKNCQGTAGQDITLSFYAKAGANWSKSGGTFGASVYSGTGTDQSLMAGLTGSTAIINTSTSALTTSWARYEFTGTVPSNSTQLVYQAINGWSGTAGADDSFYITGIQIEIGTKASRFDHMKYDEQEQLCWRYCQINDLRAAGWPTSATVSEAGYTYSKAMRATPTITSLGGFVRYGPGGQQTPSNTAHTISRWSTQCTQTIGGGMTTNAGSLNAFYFRAESEL